MDENKHLLTNIFIIFLVAVYCFLRWFQTNNNCEHKELHFVITGIGLFISIGTILVIQHFRLFLKWQALIIPLLFLFALTLPNALHGNYSAYFIDTICAAALSAFYLNARTLTYYVIITQISILYLYYNGYFGDDDITIITRWSASFISLVVLCVLIKNIKKHQITASKSSETFSSVLKATNDYVIILDKERRVKYMSSLLIKMFGFENFPYIVKNRPFVDLFKQFELKQLFCKILSENNYDAKNVEVADILGIKRSRFLNIKFQKLQNNAGFLLQATDISDISEAKNEAERANKYKSDFLANMSHELRTPLNAINGLAELELRKNLPPETKSNIEKISTSGEVLLSTINDILDISKIEAGHLDLIPSEYSFTSFMSDTINMNIVRIGNKPIKLDIDVDENIPEKLIGDEIQIRKIFNNLISNAIKYTFDGTITIKISGITKGNSIWISLSVQDTGIGISKENIDKLFHNYSMVDVESHKGIEGTGLGLSITKRLLDLMDGDISVESTHGKGSIFSAKYRQEIADSTPIGPESAKNIKNFVSFNKPNRKYENLKIIQLPNVKALIVDDVQVNLDVASGMLSVYGMQIDTANSGKDAIAKIREQKEKYDIVFMDHMMPEMDGIEATQNIRKLDNYAKNIPIIALTANAIVGIDKMFLDNGFQDYLSKPMNVKKLDDVIHKWLIDENKISVAAPQIVVSEQNEWHNGIERRSGIKRRSDIERRSSAQIVNEKEIYKKLLTENPVDGINFDESIKQFNSMPKIYIRVLGSFVKNIPVVLEKLKNPTSETLGNYKISVHGLKGSCYGIGANDLGKLAETLEKEATAQNLTAVLEKNVILLEQVHKLLEQISKIMEKADKINATHSKKSEPNKELLQKLLSEAESYDIEKINEILSELEKFNYEKDNDLIKNLRGFADSFNYDKIIELLS